MGSQEVSSNASTKIDWQNSLMKLSIKSGEKALIPLGELVGFTNLYETDIENISRFNGNDSIIIDITKKTSAPTIGVCNSVESTIDRLENNDVHLEIIQSSADDIQESLLEVVKTLIEGVLFSMLILFLFFGDIKASLIVGCSMPLSLLCALILLNLFDISFDLMTGTGMIIAIGMIVDNSIVILENCFKQKEKMESFQKASIAAVQEMLLSIFASTLTTVVVYAPMLTTKGMSAQMNVSLCLTVIFTMVASLISAITVVPLLFCFIKPKEKTNMPINKVMQVLEKKYQKIIPVLLKAPKWTIFSALILFVISILMVTQLHMDLFPSNYDGSIKVQANFRPGVTIENIDKSIQNIEEKLIEDPGFSSVELSITDNVANLTAYAEPGNKRTSEEAVEYYITLFHNETNMDISISPFGYSSGLTSLMSTGNNKEITMYSDDKEQLKTGSDQITQKLRNLPGILHVSNEIGEEKTNVRFVINQQMATAVGLTPAGVANQINALVNGITATTLTVDGEDYKVKVEYPLEKYKNINFLLAQPIAGNDGQILCLSDVAELEYDSIPVRINRRNGKYVATVTATTTSEGKYNIAEEIDRVVNNYKFPEGVEVGTSSMNETMAEEGGKIGIAIVIALILVFMVMAIQFNSMRYAGMVMLCVPFSLIGSFGLLFFSQAPLSMMAMMGFLMLIGMVVNNGILLVDATNELKKEYPLKEALLQAGLRRLRPILMTTLTTVLSMLPMVLSNNSGMAMMRGMGFVIIGGLCASTILALFLMPSFYLIMSGENKRS